MLLFLEESLTTGRKFMKTLKNGLLDTLSRILKLSIKICIRIHNVKFGKEQCKSPLNRCIICIASLHSRQILSQIHETSKMSKRLSWIAQQIACRFSIFCQFFSYRYENLSPSLIIFLFLCTGKLSNYNGNFIRASHLRMI